MALVLLLLLSLFSLGSAATPPHVTTGAAPRRAVSSPSPLPRCAQANVTRVVLTSEVCLTHDANATSPAPSRLQLVTILQAHLPEMFSKWAVVAYGLDAAPSFSESPYVDFSASGIVPSLFLTAPFRVEWTRSRPPEPAAKLRLRLKLAAQDEDALREALSPSLSAVARELDDVDGWGFDASCLEHFVLAQECDEPPHPAGGARTQPGAGAPPAQLPPVAARPSHSASPAPPLSAPEQWAAAAMASHAALLAAVAAAACAAGAVAARVCCIKRVGSGGGKAGGAKAGGAKAGGAKAGGGNAEKVGASAQKRHKQPGAAVAVVVSPAVGRAPPVTAPRAGDARAAAGVRDAAPAEAAAPRASSSSCNRSSPAAALAVVEEHAEEAEGGETTDDGEEDALIPGGEGAGEQPCDAVAVSA